MTAAAHRPDETVAKANRLAERLGLSRAELYRLALREYLERHDDDWVTAALNSVCDRGVGEPDAFVGRAARRLLKTNEW